MLRCVLPYRRCGHRCYRRQRPLRPFGPGRPAKWRAEFGPCIMEHLWVRGRPRRDDGPRTFKWQLRQLLGFALKRLDV